MSSHLAGLFTAAAFLSLTTLARAQPTDEDETGDLGGTVHETDEVIGPDGTETDEPPPDEPPPDEPPAQAKATGNAGYAKGFFIKSDDGAFSLKLKARVEPYLYMTRVATGEKEVKGAFQIRRARIVLEGNLHGDDLRYKFQPDFGKGNPSLKDFYVDARLSGDLWFRAGQWKRPFSRQQITSSGKLELTDRSITDKIFGAGRDIGVAIHNGYEESPEIEWTVGVWNGTGDAAQFEVKAGPADEPIISVTNVPAEFKPVFIGRVGLNSGGVKGYSEADLDGGPLRWAAAASFWGETNFDEDTTSNDKFELDYIVKAQGFSSTGGFYAMTRQAGVHPLSDQELAYIGFHMQAGYMIKPTWQAVARFALVDARVDDLVAERELTLGASYYGWGHDAKLQGSVRMLKRGEAKLINDLLFQLGANVGF
ncbi:MAG: hypothetical protein IPL61_32700 [Myxococcales bacterium]|nr:hypothetical protein [Myxococcales bacterium]